MNTKKILIADDEKQTSFCISLALRMKGYETVVAENGEKALQIIKENKDTSAPIDLLVCDIQMPKLNGEELIDKLNELNIKVPTLVVTGFGEKELVVRLMRKGCRDFVDKPFEPAEIEERIGLIFAEENKTVLEKKRLETMSRIGVRTRQIIHDMNNVLGGVVGYTEMALEQLDQDDPKRNYIAKISKITSRATEMCKTILSTTSCDDPSSFVSTEINYLTELTAAILKDVIAENVTLETKTDGAPLWCIVNLQRIQQALLNMGINAAQAMPNGGRLTLACSREEENGTQCLRLSVSDTGTGIKREVIDRIFESGYTTKKEGGGIGLTTVKEIVDEHGGTIKVDSVLGKGTTFIIDIPEKQPETSNEKKELRHEHA
jgi:signal transduction histidine kinase